MMHAWNTKLSLAHLDQYCLMSKLPYGITMPQWVNWQIGKYVFAEGHADVFKPWEIWMKFFRQLIFKLILQIDGWGMTWMNVGPYWWLVNIGLGNGLVSSGNKPLP